MRSQLPVLGPALPRRESRLAAACGRCLLRALGWTIEGDVPNIRSCVAIMAPHTSNWDFPVAVAALLALGLRVDWLGKSTIFVWPFAPFLRALGGIPVDRSAPEGAVLGAVSLFADRERVFLGLAPEGTRRKVERWKSGFHRIARAAGVPIVPVALDWRKRAVVFHAPRETTDDYERDLAELQRLFTPEMARHPHDF